MRILDLFCGAGGAGMGYHRAGFEVVGMDAKAQPNYPFEFHQRDVMTLEPDDLAGFDAIHASPPCHRYSRITGVQGGTRDRYPDLVEPVRQMLTESGLPFVIENVEGSPLIDPVRLCGSSFGLDVRRHRLFETNWHLAARDCDHGWQTPRFRSLNKHGRLEGRLASVVGVYGHINYAGEFELRCKAMGIDWMSNRELSQAIPPAYTQYIGTQLHWRINNYEHTNHRPDHR